MDEIQKIKEKQRLEAFDWRTGLFSILSSYAREDLQARFSLAARTNPPAQVALLFFDLDSLKPANDAFGESGGDDLLEAFGRAIKKTFRDYDFKFREGTKGDEFGVVTIGLSENKLLEKLRELSSNFADFSSELSTLASFSAGAYYLEVETKKTNRGDENFYEKIVLPEEEISQKLKDRLEGLGEHFGIYIEPGPKTNVYSSLEKAKTAGKNRLVMFKNGEFSEPQIIRQNYTPPDRNAFEEMKKRRLS